MDTFLIILIVAAAAVILLDLFVVWRQKFGGGEEIIEYEVDPQEYAEQETKKRVYITEEVVNLLSNHVGLELDDKNFTGVATTDDVSIFNIVTDYYCFRITFWWENELVYIHLFSNGDANMNYEKRFSFKHGVLKSASIIKWFDRSVEDYYKRNLNFVNEVADTLENATEVTYSDDERRDIIGIAVARLLAFEAANHRAKDLNLKEPLAALIAIVLDDGEATKTMMKNLNHYSPALYQEIAKLLNMAQELEKQEQAAQKDSEEK